MFIPVGEKKGEKALLPESVGCARKAELSGATIFRGRARRGRRAVDGGRGGGPDLLLRLCGQARGTALERLKKNKHVFVRLRALRQGKVWAAGLPCEPPPSSQAISRKRAGACCISSVHSSCHDGRALAWANFCIALCVCSVCVCNRRRASYLVLAVRAVLFMSYLSAAGSSCCCTCSSNLLLDVDGSRRWRSSGLIISGSCPCSSFETRRAGSRTTCTRTAACRTRRTSRRPCRSSSSG